MTAVLGFLRAEGGAYHRVMRTAGTLAAAWAVDGLSTPNRSLLHRLPRWWRTRRVLAFARRTIRDSYSTTRVLSKLRKGRVHVEIHGSVFCRPREPQAQPLCDFHAALIVGLLAAFDVPAQVRIETCTGAAGAACTMTLELAAADVVESAA
jgi:hypothetical protein